MGLIGGLMNLVKSGVFFCALVALAGCASQTGEVPNGQGGYLIAKQAATGFPGLGNLKAEAMTEADQYCAGQGREFLLMGATETEPPYVLGNYPRAEISFQCAVPETPPVKPPIEGIHW
jgi:hypothetical protein